MPLGTLGDTLIQPALRPLFPKESEEPDYRRVLTVRNDLDDAGDGATRAEAVDELEGRRRKRAIQRPAVPARKY